ncbi:MAG: hypothetical protein AB7O73_04065 [Bacteroidia bacterium]
MSFKNIFSIQLAAIFLLTIISFSTNAAGDTNVVHIPNHTINNLRLDKLIKQQAEVIKSQLGYWELKFENRYIIIVTDETHNRMRIISAIIEEKKIKKNELIVLLSANFDKALDAKYAIYNGYLWSVFTHPFGELEDEQFIDALKQVKTLADNYGGSYTSSDLIFGGGK